MVAECTFAFDEDTHQSRNFLRILKSVPQKRAPIEVFTTAPRTNPRCRPQEPRRPRFSFFNLHNVKELTQCPKGYSVGESKALVISLENRILLPVARQYLCPKRIRRSVGGAGARRVVNEGGYMGGSFPRQHPS